MKSKFKDFLLYSLACIGITALLLSVYQPQQSSPKYTMVSSNVGSAGSPNVYVLNQETGEVRFFRSEREYATFKKD